MCVCLSVCVCVKYSKAVDENINNSAPIMY